MGQLEKLSNYEYLKNQKGYLLSQEKERLRKEAEILEMED